MPKNGEHEQSTSLWDAHNRFLTPVSTRRGFFGTFALSAAVAPTLANALPALAKPEFTTSSRKQDYNECDPSKTIETELGTRLLAYCDSLNGEYTLKPKDDLAEMMKQVTVESGKVYTVSDMFSNLTADLAGKFTLGYGPNTETPNNNFVFKWTIGTYSQPYGSYLTEWFDEETLRRINMIYMEWKNRQMYGIACYDNKGDEVYLSQNYTHLWNVRPSTKPNPANGS